MAQQNVCRFYKFGFCKYKDNCRNMHIHEKCDDRSCKIKNCSLRHPRKCSFYRDYKRCKYSEWCQYDHVDNEVDSLTNQFEENKRKITELEKHIQNKEQDIENLVKRIEIIQTEIRVEFKTKLDILEKNILDKDKTFEELVKKVKNLEKTIIVEKPPTDKPNVLVCEFCKFEAKSLSGLKVHIKRKHTFHEKDTYPTKCDLCEKVI